MIILQHGVVFAVEDALLDAMFRERRRIFVDLLGWNLPVSPAGCEIDQFDNASATYLIAVDDDGNHLGSMRLLPTVGPHILGSLFSSLAEDGVPCGPSIREITRLCLAQRLVARARLHVRNQLISAMVDYAPMHGIESFTGVVRPSFRASILAMGWRAAALGPEQRINGMALGAFRIDVDADTPRLLRATGIYQSTQVIERASSCSAAA